jgi:gamma-glutamyltranspeptidase/glutathione hydrolase
MDSMTTEAKAGVRASNSMVAAGNPLAVEAALAALAAGGSAVDAALSADAVMGLVEPMATSIGGDLLAMIVEADGTARTYNGTGRAPAALTADRVRDLPKQRIPDRHALSVTVPGAVRGWHDLHRRYGRLEWAAILAPAIALAETASRSRRSAPPNGSISSRS